MMCRYELENVITDLCNESKTLCEINPPDDSYFIQNELCQAITIVCLSYANMDGEGATANWFEFIPHILPNNRVIAGWVSSQG